MPEQHAAVYNSYTIKFNILSLSDTQYGFCHVFHCSVV